MKKKYESIIDLANRIVPIRRALKEAGVCVPDSEGKSIKARCPFADVYHFTDDADLSMRVYTDTNSAYCFAGCGPLTSVFVYAKSNDLSFVKSAWRLLDSVGYRPKSLNEQWKDLSEFSDPVKIISYREAFLEYCSYSIPNWVELQYSSEIFEALSKLFEVLDKVKTVENADSWLRVSKEKIKVKVQNEFLS